MDGTEDEAVRKKANSTGEKERVGGMGFLSKTPSPVKGGKSGAVALPGRRSNTLEKGCRVNYWPRKYRREKKGKKNFTHLKILGQTKKKEMGKLRTK